YTSDSLDINVGAAAAVAFLNPLGAQLDAMIAFSLGPLQLDLAAQLDAAIALQINLALQITGPTINLSAALEALALLSASLSAGLTLPSIALGAELGASAAISAALTAKLGGLNLLIQAAIDLKIPAIRAAADLQAALNAGPFVVLAFDGLDVLGAGGNMTLQEVGSQVNALFSSTIGSGPAPAKTIDPGEQVSGVIIVTKGVDAFAGLSAIIKVEP
ncbi:MAG: hypothetical protein V3S01_08380, partial [Dehalococcoidia bacterium]